MVDALIFTCTILFFEGSSQGKSVLNQAVLKESISPMSFLVHFPCAECSNRQGRQLQDLQAALTAAYTQEKSWTLH